jgi:hypothetical protein
MRVPKLVAVIGGAILVIGIAAVVGWLSLRDTWERDNAARVRQMATGVVAMVRDGNAAEAVWHREELKLLIGSRRLENPELVKLVSAANAAIDQAAQRPPDAGKPPVAAGSQPQIASTRRAESAPAAPLADERTRRKAEDLGILTRMEANAAVLIKAGDFEKAVEKLDLALDFIRASQMDKQDVVEGVARISQAKRDAQQKLAERRGPADPNQPAIAAAGTGGQASPTSAPAAAGQEPSRIAKGPVTVLVLASQAGRKYGPSAKRGAIRGAEPVQSNPVAEDVTNYLRDKGVKVEGAPVEPLARDRLVRDVLNDKLTEAVKLGKDANAGLVLAFDVQDAPPASSGRGMNLGASLVLRVISVSSGEVLVAKTIGPASGHADGDWRAAELDALANLAKDAAPKVYEILLKVWPKPAAASRPAGL